MDAVWVYDHLISRAGQSIRAAGMIQFLARCSTTPGQFRNSARCPRRMQRSDISFERFLFSSRMPGLRRFVTRISPVECHASVIKLTPHLQATAL